MAVYTIDRTALSGLIPEPVTREIMQGAIAESAVLKMARRLPNMSSKTQTINVLDALPTAYWVNGEVDNTSGNTNAFKQTTKMAWGKKRLYAEEIAVIVPIPEAVLADSNYDIWGEVKPRLNEAFGKLIDAAILFGTNKPSTWRTGLVPSAVAAGNVVRVSTNPYGEIMGTSGVIAKVEEDGWIPDGVMAAIGMRAKLRGLVDQQGQPIFKTDMQGETRYALDGMPMYFPNNGAFDTTVASLIVGDWKQLVYAIRQDMTYKIFTEGVVQDPSDGSIKYNLMQNDMVALRATMRLGWEIADPVTAYNASIQNPFPFAVYTPDTALTLSASTASVAAGATTSVTASNYNGSITAKSSAPSKATVTVSEGTVTIAGVAQGSATVTVTDELGDSATCTVTVTAAVGG